MKRKYLKSSKKTLLVLCFSQKHLTYYADSASSSFWFSVFVCRRKFLNFKKCSWYNAPINVKPAGLGEGGRQGIGRGFDRSLWPGGRAFELSCCPGSRDIRIFVRAHDHKSFPGWGISVIFDLTFLTRGREFDSNF